MSEQQDGRRQAKRKEGSKPYRRVVKQGNDEDGGGGGGGVSKTKAALRQTRRLLAKDNVSASVRQEAERKLLALEDELRTKETQQKERNNAQRYHKVRFFERQKLVRKIKKLKRAKEGGEAGLEEELFETRALLNYVLHYPMTQKYVALFPKQGPSGQEDGGEAEKDGSSSVEKASKVKERIIESMRKGTMSNEPEVELEARTADEEQQRKPRVKQKLLEEETDEHSSDRKARKGKSSKNVVERAIKSNLADDDFFAA